MQVWELIIGLELPRQAPTGLEGKARKTILELDIATLNDNDGMEKL